MKKKIVYLFITIFFLIIYRLGSFTKITFGDSLGKIVDIENCKFNLETYSITHFLYQNFTVLIYKTFPNLDPIEIGRWVNIIFAIFELNILYSILNKIFKTHLIAILGTLAFGFSFTFWKNTENVEVYTFSLVWVALYLFFSVNYLQTDQNKYITIAGLILGISFYSHIQSILLIPSYSYLCLLNYKSTKTNKSLIQNFIIPILFFLGLYIYPILNQENLKNVLSSATKTWVSDSYTKAYNEYIKDFGKAIIYLIYNFWFLNFLILYIPFKTIFKNKIVIFLAIFGLPVFIFSSIYAVSDNYVFFLNFNLAYLIVICYGLQNLIKKKELFIQYIFILFIAITPLNYTLSKYIVSNTEAGKMFHQDKIYKDGLNYYMLPWYHNNKGLIKVYLNKEETNDDIDWMYKSVIEFIELRKNKMSLTAIKEL